MRLAALSTYAVSTLLLAAVGCANDQNAQATRATTAPDTASAAGDVVPDSTPAVMGKWLTDGSVVSLGGLLNAHEIAAAETETQAWHSDSVQQFAIAMIHDHEAMQHSLDSAAAAANIAPVMSALGLELQDSLKSTVDGLKTLAGAPLDRAYLDATITSHQRLIAYYQQLSGVAERPALVGILTSSIPTLQLHLQRAQAIRSTLAMADSARRLDSLAARAQRRGRGQNTIPR